MKINDRVWSALTIFGEENNRDIFISYIENFMLGCEHSLKSSTLYFKKNDINEVNIILNNDDYILAGDMNQDGALDVLDIVTLVNIILN